MAHVREVKITKKTVNDSTIIQLGKRIKKQKGHDEWKKIQCRIDNWISWMILTRFNYLFTL